MNRYEIINKIGNKYFSSNLETNEFSYQQVLNIPLKGHKFLDLRFERDNYSIIVETKNSKNKFTQKDIEQLFDYAKLERIYKNYNNIISILYNIYTDQIYVYKDDVLLEDEKSIKSFDYYISLYKDHKNDKNNVLETTNSLNSDLYSLKIKEENRSQFVGSLLVALNNDLQYDNNLQTEEIIKRIVNKLESKIDNNDNKKIKTDLLIKILDQQEIKEIQPKDFCKLLDKIRRNLIPYIDSSTSQGEDLLNLFFTTFNKYSGKADKNQAFTPTHITDFMCEITNVNKNSRVLDPTCGSGSFLVQAMSKMLKSAGEDSELRSKIKREQLFGIEYEDKAFGLATTNMLIHEDGKTNVIKASCFDSIDWIKEKNIDIVLMNPPFNGQHLPNNCPKNKNKNMDATKGLFFVYEMANAVNKGKLATILPLQCAIGSDSSISDYKKKILLNHTLKAVFSLPDDVFHPGASVNTCVMLFELGVPHNKSIPTFFGYFKDDGFIKKKNKGRVEKIDWNETKKEWLKLFNYNIKQPGKSIVKCVDWNDEWLAEAYMETDYKSLKENNFVDTIRDFFAFKLRNGEFKNE